MITVYLRGADEIFAGSVDCDPYGPMPAMSTPTPPPATAGSEVAQWTGSGWHVLPSRPDRPSPGAVVPQEVTMRQARLALNEAGLLEAADAVIAALPMPARRKAQIEWEYALSVRRDHPLIALMISEGLATEAEVDGLFVAAAGL